MKDEFSVKVPDVSLRAVYADHSPTGSGVSCPPAARNKASDKKAAPFKPSGARPNLTLVTEPVANLDDWRAPISAPVREFICAHVNLRYGVPESDRDAFDKLLEVYDEARDALVDYLRDGGA